MGLSAIWKKKLHGNGPVIARGEAESNLGMLQVHFFLFHSNTCGYLLIIHILLITRKMFPITGRASSFLVFLYAG